MDNLFKEATKVTIKTILLNIMLVILKVVAGIFGKSQAMIADGLHSASDMITSLGVLIGNYIASKPDDDCHNYGHEKAETLVTFLLSIVLMAASLKIGYEAVILLFNVDMVKTPTVLPLAVAFISILVNEYQFFITMKVAKKSNFSSLKADAWHHRSDSLSSVAVLIGVAGAMAGIKFLEPISSICVAVIVFKVGLDILQTSSNELMDSSISKEERALIIETALTVPGVVGVLEEELKTRSHSNIIYIDITLIVNENITVHEGHNIGHKVEEKIRKSLNNVKGISVHVEPNCQNGKCLIYK